MRRGCASEAAARRATLWLCFNGGNGQLIQHHAPADNSARRRSHPVSTTNATELPVYGDCGSTIGSAGSARAAAFLPGRSMRSLRALLGAGDQGRSSSGARSAASVKPSPVQVSPTAPVSREAPLVEPAPPCIPPARSSALTTTSRASAIFLESQAVFDERQRLALGQRADAAEAVAGRVAVARLGGLAPVAVGRQPLFGGESVEAFADDTRRPSASRRATCSPAGAMMTS